MSNAKLYTPFSTRQTKTILRQAAHPRIFHIWELYFFWFDLLHRTSILLSQFWLLESALKVLDSLKWLFYVFRKKPNQLTARKLLPREATFFPSLSYFLGKKMTFKLQRTPNQYAAKCRIDRRPYQQKYTLSRHTDLFCKASSTRWCSVCTNNRVFSYQVS